MVLLTNTTYKPLGHTLKLHYICRPMKPKNPSKNKEVIPPIPSPLELDSKLPLYQYGALTGIISALVVILFILCIHYFTNSDSLDVRNQLFIEPWLCAICLFFGSQYFKKKHPNKNFHFWQGILLGSMAALFTAIGSALFVYLFCSYNPDALNRHIADLVYQNETHIKTNFIAQFGAEPYAKMLAEYKAITPSIKANDEFMKKFFPVFVLSIFVSMATRRRFVIEKS